MGLVSLVLGKVPYHAQIAKQRVHPNPKNPKPLLGFQGFETFSFKRRALQFEVR